MRGSRPLAFVLTLAAGAPGCTHYLHAAPSDLPLDVQAECARGETNCLADCLPSVGWLFFPFVGWIVFPLRQNSCVSGCNVAQETCWASHVPTGTEQKAAPALVVIRIRPATITVGRTDEAKACERQCMQIVSNCIPGCNASVGSSRVDEAKAAVQQCLDSCADQRDACLRTCPGASEHPGATSTPRGGV
jgi:hypothetical protein